MKEILWAAWPWIGFAGGILLLAMMFFTNRMRSSLTVSRWKDPVWLSWARTGFTGPFIISSIHLSGLSWRGTWMNWKRHA